MRSFRSLVAVVAVAGGAIVVQASPAAAVCASTPGTNPITISPDPPLPDPGIVVPGVPAGLLDACAYVEGDPAPEVDLEPTVDVRPTGCGIPCFVVEWDGVTLQPVTVGGGSESLGVGFQLPIPGGNYGGLCLNSGQPCPE